MYTHYKTRLENMLKIIIEYHHPGNLTESLTDIITDAMLMAAYQGLNLDLILARSKAHYEIETIENPCHSLPKIKDN